MDPFIHIKFEPRDAWVGVYVDTERRRAYVCVVPFLPIIISYGRR